MTSLLLSTHGLCAVPCISWGTTQTLCIIQATGEFCVPPDTHWLLSETKAGSEKML